MICIGIDTGTETGFAEWDTEKQCFLSVTKLKIHQAMDRVKSINELNPGKILVRVEDPRQRTWFGKIVSREEERKKLQGVGSVKRDASIWDDFLKDLGVKYEMVAPKQNVTKLSQDRFKSYTGWAKQTNEHSRDAAMLVFGLKSHFFYLNMCLMNTLFIIFVY